ncbi:NERD domain-containing protein [Geodermatophilus sp. SYSU D01062]
MGDPSWLCLPCGRPFATGRPGRSAELEAMRRMRAEPVVERGRASPSPWHLDVRPPVVSPRPAPAGVRRWGRRLALSLLVVLASSPLTAAGQGGRVLAVLVGGPAAVLFWVSAAGLVVSGLRGVPASRRQPPPSGWPASPPRRAAARGGPVRVVGAEDNWVKGVRGEHAVGAALTGTGLPVLHDRRLRAGSDANIDHLVVAADAVYVVDAKNLAGSLTTAGDQLRVDGRDRTALLDGVRRQADEVVAALRRLGVPAPVRAALCLTGAARPAGVQFAGGVLLTTPDTVSQVVTLPGLLADDQRARIADLLAWAFPPAASS